MNLTIFAGSAQFVMVDLWAAPLPILEIILAAAVINLRYLLIGASLNPIFKGSKMVHKSLIMHFYTSLAPISFLINKPDLDLLIKCQAPNLKLKAKQFLCPAQMKWVGLCRLFKSQLKIN